MERLCTAQHRDLRERGKAESWQSTKQQPGQRHTASRSASRQLGSKNQHPQHSGSKEQSKLRRVPRERNTRAST